MSNQESQSKVQDLDIPTELEGQYFAKVLYGWFYNLEETEEGGTYWVSECMDGKRLGVYAPDEGAYYEHEPSADLLHHCNVAGVDYIDSPEPTFSEPAREDIGPLNLGL